MPLAVRQRCEAAEKESRAAADKERLALEKRSELDDALSVSESRYPAAAVRLSSVSLNQSLHPLSALVACASATRSPPVALVRRLFMCKG